ncbi:MAG: hypothetical protein AB7H97_00150 [Pseudobdellovibrionaceae bacterium]
MTWRSLIVAVSAGLILLSGAAYSNDLDGEARGRLKNREFGETVILKVDKRNGKMKMVRSSDVVGSSKQAKNLAKSKEKSFKKVPKSKVRSELDREAGSSSWYYYYTGYGYPYYYSYSYNYYYTPYYYYNYGYYNYYYYGWYYYW